MPDNVLGQSEFDEMNIWNSFLIVLQPEFGFPAWMVNGAWATIFRRFEIPIGDSL